jgi:predicted DCC family thiol-disulfide oxidoreductase YuxK
MESIMETLLRGWDNGPKRRSGRAMAMGISAAGGDAAIGAAALASITGRGIDGDHVALTIYYNGACQVCRKHVARFQRLSAGRSRLIAWTDTHAAPWALRRWHVDPAEAPLRRYAVTDGGRLLSGAAAFARLWREIPGYRALGLLVGLPGVRQVADMVYSFIYVRDLRRRMAEDGKLCGARNLCPAP